MATLGRGNEGRSFLRPSYWAEIHSDRYSAGPGKRPGATGNLAPLVVFAASKHRLIHAGREKRELFFGSIRLVMRAVDAKEATTAGHSERVALLAREIAAGMGLMERELDEIYLAGLLHDVGKLAIPESVLTKPNVLTETDMAIIRRHPELGAALVSDIALPDTVVRGILEHHERLDGAGYPFGLSGKSISLAGRILKVADVYDALGSRRHYKEPYGLEETLEILDKGSGAEFDEEVVGLIHNSRLAPLYLEKKMA